MASLASLADLPSLGAVSAAAGLSYGNNPSSLSLDADAEDAAASLDLARHLEALLADHDDEASHAAAGGGTVAEESDCLDLALEKLSAILQVRPLLSCNFVIVLSTRY
jgi:hypothetical protein